jgi:hypothetical protein
MKKAPQILIFSIILLSAAIPRITCGQSIPEMLSRVKMNADFEKLGGIIINDKGVEIAMDRLEKSTLDNHYHLRMELANQLLLSGRTEDAIVEVERIIKDADTAKSYKGPDKRQLSNFQALCYFRLGEEQNCIMDHNGQSCIFPIREKGVYRLKNPTRKAIQLYTDLLYQDSSDLGSRWLLNIAYMTLGGYPDSVPSRFLIPATRFDSEFPYGEFTNAAPALGLDKRDLAGSVVMEDFDNDGDLDIFTDAEGFDSPSRYYENKGNGSFAEKISEAGLDGQVSGRVVAIADYNNDGLTDIFVCRGAWLAQEGNYPPNSLLKNLGKGRFEDVTVAAGLLSFHPTSSASWADYDNDGFVDLFVGNETQDASLPHPCQLYHNNGDGTFTEVSAMSGINVREFVKCVNWGDYDNDGDPDLYISNIKGSNFLFRNDGRGPKGDHVFTDVTRYAGVADPYYGFPAFFFDFDNDGWLDIYASTHSLGYIDITKTIVGEYIGRSSNKANQTRLYRNNHDGTFTDIGSEAGLDRIIYAMSCSFGDIDNDGYKDVYAGTGFLDLRYLFPNILLRNHDGKYFEDVTSITRTGHLQKGHGISIGDIDNDGDQDIYSVMGGGFKGDVYQNALFLNPGNANNWVNLKLVGTSSNRSALGARIKLTLKTSSGTRTVYSTVGNDGTFGASSLQQEIGIADAKIIDKMEIEWPLKKNVQTFTNIRPNRFYRITEGEDTPVQLQRKPIKMDASSSAKHPVKH